MKHILLITEAFPYGESENGFLRTEFEELCKHFDVTIVTHHTEKPLTYSIPTNVKCFRYHWNKKSIIGMLYQLKKKDVWIELAQIIKNRTIKNKLFCLLKALHQSRQAEQLEHEIRKISKNHAVDMIYTYWCTPATLAAVRLKKAIPKLKVITRFHGCDLFLERTPENWQFFRNYIANYSDRLFFVSNAGKIYFVDHWNNDSKSFIAYLGCPAFSRIACKKADTLTLISCSNLISLKRVDLILNGLQLLPSKLQIHWHHFGDGPLRIELEHIAQNIVQKCSNLQYTFHGYVPNDFLSKKYIEANAQLFITTSSTEGLPISITEAFAMGLPAIGTAVGGIPELIENGKTGFLLPPDPTPQQVSDAILTYATLPPIEKQQMSNLAYQKWETIFNAYKNAEQFVQNLLDMF